jgi:hypothetical protein
VSTGNTDARAKAAHEPGPKPILGVEHLEVVDRHALEAALGRERRTEVLRRAREGRNRHAAQFVAAQQPAADLIAQRRNDRVDQRPVAELAVVTDGHRQHHQPPTMSSRG